jgi:hypothetical protein
MNCFTRPFFGRSELIKFYYSLKSLLGLYGRLVTYILKL